MAKDRNTFMGITVEGDNYYDYRDMEQYPIEQLYPEFQAAFEKGVKAIMWYQYVPAWNDGDECRFTVGEVHVTGNAAIATEWLNEGRYVSDDTFAEQYPNYDGYSDLEYFTGYGDHPDGMDSKEFFPDINRHYEVALRTIFGHNTNIVVTPDRVVQFEYYDEY